MYSPELIREFLDYDPETGVLTWKCRPGLAGKASAWNTRYAGKPITSVNGHGYIQLSILKKRFEAHRIAWAHFHGAFPDGNIDHINGIKTDNRIENLRIATTAQNSWNSPVGPRNTSGVKNVYWHRGARKYLVSLVNDGQWHNGGLHASIGEAATARDRLAAELRAGFDRR